ncbi:flavin reductase (DIM6/NTAB) family NADH-FMN oxidoreductase RutF [Catenuloplanes nepalensis]|uniref:Flavin reductase (DIM6/NTAB) family NADH-FMN oxidoreductase RutF n=1 Tax=Catenuloplanes nepalensis TaxID=587533 RepID=A0ABT9MNY0_9ACTN|nr:flavin reductase family protein [Catenuloplanes nepalensis]MDP9793036.1 flavin reductase (DIM6/NTAB) family NADH-FMN oxidoreductase RutF [Catenuloplanes nepalensis]
MHTSVDIAPDRFRQVMSHFCSGIVVVTASSDGVPVGLACQSFASLSLDPPLITFNVARTSRSWPLVRAAGGFAVNILGAAQRATCQVFAVSGADKFAGLSWQPGGTGAPLLADALAHIECRLEAVYDGGDHEIVVGRVVALQATAEPAEPLLYYRREYRRLGGHG